MSERVYLKNKEKNINADSNISHKYAYIFEIKCIISRHNILVIYWHPYQEISKL